MARLASRESTSTGPARLMGLQRRAQIVELVCRRGEVRVNELAQMFGVSAVTIRTDLEHLEAEGSVVRDHGGALPGPAVGGGPARSVQSLLAIEQRAGLHLDAKQRIGRAAAAMVQPGDTILMDAGTTVVEMAPHLDGITPLKVVTHALNVALQVGTATTAEVILLGGTLNRTAASTQGPLTEKALTDFVVNKLFLGTQALDDENGLTDTTLEIAQIKRAMMQAARQVILLVDSSKWGHNGFIRVAPLETVQTVITDEGLPASARQVIQDLGLSLVVV